ncbi:MAG: S41 family peptidase [Holosporaceae bacterium]|jgi:carboxyl-terminal processing protease|nr:S41 family peptidase [Holosporaceae bacterium]
MTKLKISLLLTIGALLSNTCCSGGSLKNSIIKKQPPESSEPSNSSKSSKNVQEIQGEIVNNKSDAKCSLIIPENIKKSVPEEMQYMVFLQMIFGFIRSEYVNELEDGEITEKAIAGVLSSLDPHSGYLNEKAFASLRNQTDGEFGGLGIEIMMDEGFIRIISPIDDTPADKAGLRAGDLIVYINDEFINGISSEEALEKLRGDPKTKVKLKIKRGEKSLFDVEIERDIIKIESVKTEILDNIGYIRISTFDKNTTQGLKKFIKDNDFDKLCGLVIDIRNNPGGLLDEAVSVSDIFLDGGKIVSTRGRTKDNSKDFFATKGDLTKGKPLVVLINSGTASAPEIFAGAIRDNKRGIIVGTRSFGKGSVQKVIPLSEKTALKLTIAKHFTPNGECIQANGIMPDIEADFALIKKPENMFIVREEILNNALDADKKAKNKKMTEEMNKKSIDALSKKKSADKKNPDIEEDEETEMFYRKLPLKERIEKDYQLNKAFDTIKAVEKFKSMSDKTHEK